MASHSKKWANASALGISWGGMLRLGSQEKLRRAEKEKVGDVKVW